jgi:hypothetical protein
LIRGALKERNANQRHLATLGRASPCRSQSRSGFHRNFNQCDPIFTCRARIVPFTAGAPSKAYNARMPCSTNAPITIRPSSRRALEADLILVHNVLAHLDHDEEALTGWWRRLPECDLNQLRRRFEARVRLLQREVDCRLEEPALDQARVQLDAHRKLGNSIIRAPPMWR